MARGSKYVCATCDNEFYYCPNCTVTKPTYDAERYCSKGHADIFEILSKHGCSLATAEETLVALTQYDTTNLKESIKAHIASLQPKKVEKRAKAKAEVKLEEVEITE